MAGDGSLVTGLRTARQWCQAVPLDRSAGGTSGGLCHHRCPRPTRGPGDTRSRQAGRVADSPLHPVNVNDPDHLEERQEDQVQGCGVLVEDLQPVAPRPQREAGGREEAE